MHSADHDRDLTAEEIRGIPEVAELPEGSRVLYTRSWGTYDGTRFDGIDPSALYDAFFVCPQPFLGVATWLEQHLAALGWPSGSDVTSARVGDVRTGWRQWSREKEEIDLIDFSESTWTGFAKPPDGWSLVRINYSRKPARDFASEDEYQSWFKDGAGKGDRWRR